MKDDKIMATGDDLHISTRAIYFARWPVNGIGGGQHGVVSTALRALPFWTFHMLGVRHMLHLPACKIVKTPNTNEWIMYSRHVTLWFWLLCKLLLWSGWALICHIFLKRCCLATKIFELEVELWGDNELVTWYPTKKSYIPGSAKLLVTVIYII